jgi:hypothetical protein
VTHPVRDIPSHDPWSMFTPRNPIMRLRYAQSRTPPTHVVSNRGAMNPLPAHMLSMIDESLRHCAYGRYFVLTSATISVPGMNVGLI